jgi:hypothetical protein
MFHKATVEAQADSILDLLIAQCADLESLLALARRETAAAREGDFAELMRVITARAELGERLEIHQRQIAAMREQLNSTAEAAWPNATTARAEALVNGILLQDETTRPLLVAARERIAAEARELEQKRRGLSAYLRDGRNPALACDQLA